MGIFENFYGQNQKKEQLAAEQRAMNFNREQNLHANTLQEEQVEILERESRSDLIKWQQDLDSELESIAFKLTGWKKENGVWIRTDKQPLCNSIFMNDVVSPQLEPWLSKNLVNSNLSEDRILRDLRATADDIADNMADKWDQYEIDFVNYDLVLRLLKNTMRNSAYRALNGWTKRVDASIIKRVESLNETGKEKSERRGLFGG